MNEFALIARYFAAPAAHSRAARDGSFVAGESPSNETVLGIGDDCALLAVRPGEQLAVSTDLLVAGRHFFDDVDAASLGWKALAVNLSDLAAMGARPVAFTLGLALPSVDPGWLDNFSRGLFACADAFDCALVGGDTTRGPLTLSITVFGAVVAGRALRRDSAVVGDDVWLSGTVGGAALALRRLQASRAGDAVGVDAGPLPAALRDALERPAPRIALGLALAGVAHAAIDVSDGLAQDLGHVLTASRCTARIDVDAIPVPPALVALDTATRRRLALTGGDDYELCFTAPPALRMEIEAIGAAGVPLTRIGSIDAERGGAVGAADGTEASDARGTGDGNVRRLRLVDANGADWPPAADAPPHGFDHFA